MNEAITRDASRVLLSDGRLWFVCRRLVDTLSDDVKPKRCLNLAFLLYYNGIINVNAPSDALNAPRVLSELLLGLWCAL